MDEETGNWRPADLDDWLSGDYAAFDDCIEGAAPLSDGYWSPFVTLAWIATRDSDFTAATQLYETRAFANRGGPHSASAWMVVGNKAGMASGRTLSAAEQELRLALEAGRLSGGIATNTRTGELIDVDRPMWTRWDRAFVHDGVQLLPGFHDFRWPSEAVRAAFPVQDRPVDTAEDQTPDRPVVMSTGPALRECAGWLTSQFADPATKLKTKDDFKAEALQLFCGRLSGRGFRDTWSKVVKDFPERATAGAKRKSGQPD